MTIYQQIVMLVGTIEITIDNRCYCFKAGDCLVMQVEGTSVFENPTRKPARCLVASVTEVTSGRKS